MKDHTQKVAELLLQIKAIKLNAKNPFTWASGIKSPIYCDNRLSLSFPFVRNQIKHALVEKSRSFGAFDVVAGVATAGIPHGALLADALGLPFIYIRGSAKGHGRKNRIEGQVKSGQKALVVEDLISTAGSSLDAISALEEDGVEIAGLLAIFTYGFDLAEERLNKRGIKTETLTDYITLLSVAEEMHYIDQKDQEILATWREAPSSWHPK